MMHMPYFGIQSRNSGQSAATRYERAAYHDGDHPDYQDTHARIQN
jgi:hypothetical protein